MNASLESAHDDVDDSGSLRLAPGVQLLGEYTDSGFSQPQYLLRRPDGQVILVSRLLYLVVAAIAEHDDLEAVAKMVSETFGRPVSADNVGYLITGKLRALGVLEEPAENAAPIRANPLLGLRLQIGVVPERAYRIATAVLRPFFRLPFVIAALAALALGDAWAVTHGSTVLGAGVNVASHPVLLLALTLLTFVAMGFHELGHATACRYSGGNPGAMGVGIYLIWPAFYTDVTDAYRLNRRGRLRTDLGGIYFNLLFALAALAGYLVTGFAPFLGLVVLSQMQALYQLLPFVRLDGYYILGDLIGVPNLFSYVRATAATLLPVARARHHQAQRTMSGLTRGASLAVRTWVALTVPILLVNLALAVYLAPRVAPAYWRAAKTTAQSLVNAAAAGHVISVTNASLQLVFVAIPLLGWAILGAHAVRAGLRSLGRVASSVYLACRQAGSLGVLAALVLTAVAFAAAVWVGTNRHASTPFRWAAPSAPQASSVSIAPPGQALLPPESALPAARPENPAQATGAPPAQAAPPARAATAAQAALPVEVSGTTAIRPTTSPYGPNWTVRPGEDLWSIAQQVLNGALGRPSSEAETRLYWINLVAANSTVADPNLLHPGEVVVLPPTSEPTGTTAAQGTATLPAQPSATPPVQANTASGAQQNAQTVPAKPVAPQGPSGGIVPNTPQPQRWSVRSGDNLWSVAEQVVSGALGRPAYEAETRSYWISLIAANATTTPDPNRIYPGELLTLPPT